jgi:phospholipid/cholesterol/gamma-HCH transport system substrate-binding protein
MKSVQSLVDKSTADLKTANIPEAIAQLNKTVKRLEQLARGQQGDVDVILANLRRVSENLMKLSESAKQYPSQVLFGSAPPRKEEKK